MKQKRRTANVFHRESEVMIFIPITLSPLLYADPLGFLGFLQFLQYLRADCMFKIASHTVHNTCQTLPSIL